MVAAVAASVSASVAEAAQAAAASGEAWRKKAGIAMREELEQEAGITSQGAWVQGAWVQSINSMHYTPSNVCVILQVHGPPPSLKLTTDQKYAERYGIAAASAGEMMRI
jgi:hypothetical protein